MKCKSVAGVSHLGPFKDRVQIKVFDVMLGSEDDPMVIGHGVELEKGTYQLFLYSGVRIACKDTVVEMWIDPDQRCEDRLNPQARVFNVMAGSAEEAEGEREGGDVIGHAVEVGTDSYQLVFNSDVQLNRKDVEVWDFWIDFTPSSEGRQGPNSA